MSQNVKRGLVAVGVVLALGYMIYLTMSANEVTCEVCIEFRGETDCRKATGKTVWRRRRLRRAPPAA